MVPFTVGRKVTLRYPSSIEYDTVSGRKYPVAFVTMNVYVEFSNWDEVGTVPFWNVTMNSQVAFFPGVREGGWLTGVRMIPWLVSLIADSVRVTILGPLKSKPIVSFVSVKFRESVRLSWVYN